MPNQQPNTIPRKRPSWPVFLLGGVIVFTILALLTAFTQYWVRRDLPETPHLFLHVVRYLGLWLPWSLLVPIIFELTIRRPLTRDEWTKSLLIHLIVSLLWLPIYWMIILLEALALGTLSLDQILPEFTKSFGFHLFTDYHWYWIIVLAAHAWVWLHDRINQQRRQTELELKNLALSKSLAEARLSGLQSQLQPHFLYNTHNTIAALIREGNQSGALRVLSQLSALLRGSLELDPQQMVSLQHELDLLDNYLAIQKVRFPERLRIHQDIDPQCLKSQLPSMILQPLVENAVQHGILSEANGDTITIKVARSEGDLFIQITNATGPQSKDSQGFGIGLKNTRQRLHHIYGDNQQLDLEYLDSNRIAATIKIPFRT